MSDHKGKVTFVNVKEFDDGGKSVSFKIAGDDRWFRAGKKRYAGILEKGSYVSFSAKEVSDSAAKVVGDISAASGKSAGEGGSKASGGGSWGSNDAAIRYQSARKDALVMAGLALQAGAVKLPVKEANKLAAIEALVDLYTANYYADIETKGAVARTAPAKTEEPDEEREEEEEEEEDDE